MKILLMLSFGAVMLLIFFGSYLLATGHTREDYLPFFKIAVGGFIFCVLLKLYIDFRKRKDNRSVTEENR